jgi:AcrR family transcriptional regulator
LPGGFSRSTKGGRYAEQAKKGAGVKFESFRKLIRLSKEDISRGLLEENRDRIKIKKEKVAVRNLVKILDAALAISNIKGFASMSLRDLSSEASLSMGALYSYISSKEELLDMIQQQGRIVVARVMSENLEGIDEPAEKLQKAIQVHLYLSEVLQPWFYFSYMETKNLPREAHRKAIESELFTEGIFAGIIEAGVAKGVFRQVDPRLSAALIKAMLQDWYLKRWKYERRKVTVEEYGEFLVDFVLTYLLIGDEKNTCS